jgi:hypothetical protein
MLDESPSTWDACEDPDFLEAGSDTWVASCWDVFRSDAASSDLSLAGPIPYGCERRNM